MKNQRQKRTVAILSVLFASTVFTWFSSPSIAAIRNVDFVKIFAGGILLGVMLTLLKDLFYKKSMLNAETDAS